MSSSPSNYFIYIFFHICAHPHTTVERQFIITPRENTYMMMMMKKNSNDKNEHFLIGRFLKKRRKNGS